MSSGKSSQKPKSADKPSPSVESHIFRCAVDDFNSLLQKEKEYRYEYECGNILSGEEIKLWFDIQNSTRGSRKRDFIEIQGGGMEKTELPVLLSVTPKLLANDGTILYTCAERTVNLKNNLTFSFEEALQVDVLKNNRAITRDNRCLFEFHVTLTLENHASSNNGKSKSPASSQNKQLPAESKSSNVKRALESTRNESENLKKIKLDSMQEKLTTDLKTVLISQNQADVVFDVKTQILKAHRIILSARSKILADMFTEENKVDGAWSAVIEDVDPSVMKALLEYIYTGKVEENWKDFADQLLLAASRYGLTELVDYLDMKIPELFTVDNSCVYLQLSKRLELKHMEDEMTKFFLKNKDAIIKTSAFEELREKNPAVLVDWLLAKS